MSKLHHIIYKIFVDGPSMPTIYTTIYTTHLFKFV